MGAVGRGGEPGGEGGLRTRSARIKRGFPKVGGKFQGAIKGLYRCIWGLSRSVCNGRQAPSRCREEEVEEVNNVYKVVFT